MLQNRDSRTAIPDRLLLKPGALTDSEWEILRRHARIGYELVESIAFLAGAAAMVLTHHERFDGSGYPQKRKGTRFRSAPEYLPSRIRSTP
jgi:HD-GYP domain-containing protein (c-di-GMP phosphodiesterase class II)